MKNQSVGAIIGFDVSSQASEFSRFVCRNQNDSNCSESCAELLQNFGCQ